MIGGTRELEPVLPLVVERREQADLAVAREIADLVRSRQPIVLGLAAGDTPFGVYRELARMRREEALDFARVTCFSLDEYLGLRPDHPAAFARWMRERIVDELHLLPEQVRGLRGDLRREQIPEHCGAYEREIRAGGGIDLQILGIGRNGHIAFNEPGSLGDSRTREVELAESTRADAAATFGGIEAVPRRALTLGIGTILEARRIRLLAFGRHKAAIARRALEDPIGPELPATFLREHADLRVWLDREAAAELRSEATAQLRPEATSELRREAAAEPRPEGMAELRSGRSAAGDARA